MKRNVVQRVRLDPVVSHTRHGAMVTRALSSSRLARQYAPGNCAARASFWNLGGSQRANGRGGRPDRSTHRRRSALARRCDGDGVRTDRSLPQGLPTSLEPEIEHRIAAFGRGGTSASRRSSLTRPRSIAFITSTHPSFCVTASSTSGFVLAIASIEERHLSDASAQQPRAIPGECSSKHEQRRGRAARRPALSPALAVRTLQARSGVADPDVCVPRTYPSGPLCGPLTACLPNCRPPNRMWSAH